MAPPNPTPLALADERPLGYRSQHAPAVAELNTTLYVAWMTDDSTRRIHLAQSTDAQKFGDTVALPVTTQASPSLVSFKNKLYLAWRANDASNSIYLSSSASADGARWTPSQRLDFSTPREPVLHVWGAKLCLAWTANDPSHQLYFALTEDGVHWSIAYPMGKNCSEESPTLLSEPMTIHAVAPEGPLPTGTRLSMTSSGDGKAWSDPTRLEYSSAERPAVVEDGGTSNLLFAEPGSQRQLHLGKGKVGEWTTRHHNLEDPANLQLHGASRIESVVFNGKVRLLWREGGLSNGLRVGQLP